MVTGPVPCYSHLPRTLPPDSEHVASTVPDNPGSGKVSVVVSKSWLTGLGWPWWLVWMFILPCSCSYLWLLFPPSPCCWPLCVWGISLLLVATWHGCAH